MDDRSTQITLSLNYCTSEPLQIRDLQEVADCSVTIVTGDSVLTASHVASEVGLIASEAASNKAKGKKSSKKSKKGPKKTATKDGEGKTALLLTVTEHGVSVARIC